MILRNLSLPIARYKKEYPVIGIVGPRQSGKTTLARKLFNDYAYVSLENIDLRQYATRDPRGFFSDYCPPLIIDEAQRAPEIFSYLQELVDTNDSPAQYVLTGSQQFLLLEKITQSLAGRIILFKLYPLTVNELIFKEFDESTESIITLKNHKLKNISAKTIELIFQGMYPRIHDKNLDATKWLENYVATYIERDIRLISNIENLSLFEIFLKTAASFSGQLVNFAAISNTVGISQPTAKKWFSLLETSGIIFFIPPYYKNYRKRLIKTPKLYFSDTGLLCFLLSLRSANNLTSHPLYGNIFETFIVSELYKRIAHTGTSPQLFFWRDRTGNEIDILLESGNKLLPIEIKAAKTYHEDFFSTIKHFCNFSEAKKGYVLYNGELLYQNTPFPVIPWWMM